MGNISAELVINRLNLQKHPEGGWYSETYRSSEDVNLERGCRQLATVIYFMLKGKEISAFHRLKSDEFWYFHQGAALNVHIISSDGEYSKVKLGCIGKADSIPQLLLPAGCWFAAEPEEKNSYSLVSCSVHPGFDFQDFELAEKSKLVKKFPDFEDIINKFCIL